MRNRVKKEMLKKLRGNDELLKNAMQKMVKNSEKKIKSLKNNILEVEDMFEKW